MTEILILAFIVVAALAVAVFKLVTFVFNRDADHLFDRFDGGW